MKLAFPIPMKISTTKDRILLFIKSLVTSAPENSKIILSVQFAQIPGRKILQFVICVMDVFITSA